MSAHIGAAFRHNRTKKSLRQRANRWTCPHRRYGAKAAHYAGCGELEREAATRPPERKTRDLTRNLLSPGRLWILGQAGRPILAAGDLVVVPGAVAEDMALERNAEFPVD